MSIDMLYTVCGHTCNLAGLLVGLVSFFFTYLGYWACIKGEYYFTKRIWILFFVLGLLFCISSLFCESVILGASFAVVGMILLWGVGEVIQQEKRVEEGWFPKNPKRKK